MCEEEVCEGWEGRVEGGGGKGEGGESGEGCQFGEKWSREENIILRNAT